MRFDIQPYTGALPITFGMTRAKVHRLLGPPESSHPLWDDSGVSEHCNRTQYNVEYTNAGAVELEILGQPIWTVVAQLDPNPVLLALDPEPVEFVGFWFFLGIGVTSTGYHDGDSAQRAVTVFPRSKYAELLGQAKPADTRRYRLLRK